MRNTTNILIFAPYYPPHIGGVENYTKELVRHLGKNSASITVFTPNIPPICPLEEENENIKILRFPAFEIIRNYPLPKLWKLKFWQMFLGLFKNKFNISISETRFFFSSFLALLFAKIKRTKLVHIEYGAAYVNTSSFFVNSISKMYDLVFGSLIFRLSSINIATSHSVKKFIKKFCKKNIPVLYMGLDLESIDKTPPNTDLRNKYKEKIIITFTGRLYKWKGVENSVKAVISLPKEIKDKIVFIIVGDGEDYDKLKKISDNSILMLGQKTREEVFAIKKIADIYIHSSLPGGGLAASLLEAMYCSCAVIATKHEGADEIIVNNKNGIIVGESNPKKISEAIIDLVSKPEKRMAFSQKGKETVKKSFTWDIAIADFQKIITNL